MMIEKRWPSADPTKIQLYSMNTPNGIKVSVALEELGLPYEAHTINIMKGDQHTEEFLSISPNGKIPAIVDPDGPGGKSMALAESAAILIHLAEKTGKLMPSDGAGRLQCLQWLFFQVGHIGPMFGQFGHFFKFAKTSCDHPYPVKRYLDETRRLLGVLDRRLSDNAYLLGDDYSIADIAVFPWTNALDGFYEAGDALSISEFKHCLRWRKACNDRPASARGALVCAPA